MSDMDRLPNYENAMRIVSIDVIDERIRQQEKWGTQRLSWPEWITVLTEEVGEAAEQALKTHFDNGGHLPLLREELVQVSAVAVAIIEHIDDVDAETQKVRIVSGKE